ncbi:MAG TPA: kynurenine 3-monooxygenase, partial [Flavobacteriales bacterium]|nr:kynurenine 3-monooxygenase [Flavobacteriales bacterium]
MNKIAIIGAGLVGSLQAIYMARKGFEVSIYERRSDIRDAKLVAGRSINLALSDRGWKALKGAGISDEIEKIAIPMKGRMVHDVEGNQSFQPYGFDDQAIYSVSRGELNKQLLIKADEYPNVQFFFNQQVKDIDLNTNALKIQDLHTKEASEKAYDRIIGTDGAFSAVRLRLMKTDKFNFSQKYLEHGYKELHIPANADGTHKLDKHSLHIWPRGQFMLIALPNIDGSFTLTLFFPYDGEVSFNSLDTDEKVMDFFQKTFPDTLPLIPDLLKDYNENPTASLVTVRCSPWHYQDKICLMGDASHAIVPFYGQGMNSGFEDCTVFNDLFEQDDWEWDQVFSQFSAKRAPEADAISELALRNYVEMRDLTANEQWLLQKKIERKITT